MPGRVTSDQIFTLRQILEKTQEFQVDTHHLFVDCKQAYDTPLRHELGRQELEMIMVSANINTGHKIFNKSSQILADVCPSCINVYNNELSQRYKHADVEDT